MLNLAVFYDLVASPFVGFKHPVFRAHNYAYRDWKLWVKELGRSL